MLVLRRGAAGAKQELSPFRGWCRSRDARVGGRGATEQPTDLSVVAVRATLAATAGRLNDEDSYCCAMFRVALHRWQDIVSPLMAFFGGRLPAADAAICASAL